MKRILLTTLLTLFAVAAFAQKGTITTTILDSETGDGVAGAVITITPTKTPDKKQYTTSGYKGATSVASLPYGEYTLSAAFLGYNEQTITFTLSAAKLALGEIRLRPGLEIETVVKEAKALRTSTKGDTVSYNAGSFKVTADADVEGLMKKMPGITIADGAVTAQGETVKKIFVDGKEFFGEDVTTAIKSLPAQAVDRIEVYNKLSDGAEFSGMDDGEGYKAINIVTHENMRQGQFGKLYAGYGYDSDTQTEARNKYVIGGNANIFSNDTRISVIGLFNNVNQQNFSFEDILGVSGSSSRGRGGHRAVGQYMVRPQSGVAAVNSIGINYSDTWGKRDQISLQGSYFFNSTRTRNVSTTTRWYESPMPIDTLDTYGESDINGHNHRFNARMEWKISDNQNLMIRPSFSYQSNDPLSSTLGWQYGESGYSRTDNYNNAKQSGYNLATRVVYRAKLGKDGRTLTLNGDVRYSDNKNTSNTWSNLLGVQSARPPIDPETGLWDPNATYIDPETGEVKRYTELRYLRNLAPSRSYSLRGEVSYTEPLSKYTQVSLQYRVNYDNQQRDKSAYITGSAFDIGGITPDASLSNAYRSAYTTQSFGPGFRFSKDRNSFIANVYYQHATLDGEVIRADADKIRHTYNNFTYFMMGQLQINRENSLRLYVRSSTDNPSVTDLQNIYDVSNAQNITRGNPDLNPAYMHSINFHYTNSNVEKGRTFMWMFSTQMATDYNATHTLSNPGEISIDGKSYHPNFYSMPVNMNGYWSVRSDLSYGFPVTFLKSNFNLMAGINYSNTPSLLGGSLEADGSIKDGARNDTRNMAYNTSAVLGSNISENVDFTVSWNGSYSEARNSLVSGKNRYFYHTASASMKFIMPLGFTFTGSAAYTQNLGFTNNYNDSYLLCNAYIGKKIFKNKRGEIMVGVNDIFNQNTAFARTTGSGWTQNATNSVIGRYYTIQFTYNLRRFGKRGSTNIKDYDGAETRSSSSSSSSGRPMGPPPGGFHGGR